MIDNFIPFIPPTFHVPTVSAIKGTENDKENVISELNINLKLLYFSIESL